MTGVSTGVRPEDQRNPLVEVSSVEGGRPLRAVPSADRSIDTDTSEEYCSDMDDSPKDYIYECPNCYYGLPHRHSYRCPDAWHRESWPAEDFNSSCPTCGFSLNEKDAARP